MFRQFVVLFLLFFALPRFAWAQPDVVLRGAGATFPYLLYSQWIDLYQHKTKSRISYFPEGSGAGIVNLIARKIDFGATDAFLSDEEMRLAPAEILHIPTCVGAIAIIYNLQVEDELRLTPQLIADIFMGKITNWSDKAISKINPNLSLPDLNISIIHRSDSSGTTFLFTNYLSGTSTQWNEKIGSGKQVQWIAGMGLEGNPGIVELVKKVPGSIGYAELAYAIQENLPAALVENSYGHFIRPTLASVSAAANVEIPSDTRVLITNTSAVDGYPISAFTYIICYKEQAFRQMTINKAAALARFLWWTIHEGQQLNESLHYGRLPAEVVLKAEAVIRSVTFNGKPVLDEKQ
jgi:phosphate transport system substrate-binding protein